MRSATSEPAPVRAVGTVKWFNDQKGIGFITPDDASDDCFVHYTAIREGVGKTRRKTLIEGQRVEYSPAPGEKGKGPRAVDVTGIV